MVQVMEPLRTELPTEDEARLARETRKLLARHLDTERELRVSFLENGSPGEAIVIHEKIGRLLVYVLDQIARGNAVQIFPLRQELTTRQAANLLNVSRPYVIKKIEAGEIPHHMVGTHRRVTLRDLIAYKTRVDAGRDKALEELAELTQELGEDD